MPEEELKDMLTEMEKKDVIRPSSSPWASTIVLVKKQDGTHRFCADYRKLNAVTRKDAYPITHWTPYQELPGSSLWTW